MSRIGKLPVKIPSGVQVDVRDHTVTARGGKGELTRTLHAEMRLEVQDGAVLVARTLVSNMIEGGSKGYDKQLELVGVGYRASRQGEAVVLTVGYSHPVRYPVPAGITIEVPEPTKILVRGADKELVGQVAAELRKVRPPEPYKGKGILYKGERIRRKAGKTGKTTGTGAK